MSHILKTSGGKLLTLDDMKSVATSMAHLEADVISAFGLQHIPALQQKNIHVANILLQVLCGQDNLQVHKWDEKCEIATDMLLVASGKLWTTAIKDKQSCWSEFHRHSRYPIHNISQFLTHKAKQGTVYTISQFRTHKAKQGTVYTIDNRDMNKKGRPSEGSHLPNGNAVISQGAILETPQQECKRRKLMLQSESLETRQRLFPSSDIRVASIGKTVNPPCCKSIPAVLQKDFVLPAAF